MSFLDIFRKSKTREIENFEEEQEKIGKEIITSLNAAAEIKNYENYFNIDIQGKTINGIYVISGILIPKEGRKVKSVIFQATVNLSNKGKELYAAYTLDRLGRNLTISIDSLNEFKDKLADDLKKVLKEKYNELTARKTKGA